MQSIPTFLMFEGKAEEAINFHASIFKLSQTTDIHRYDINKGGIERSVPFT